MIYSYRIEGMHCSACIQKIKTALVGKVEVAAVTLNPPQLQIEAKSPPQLPILNGYLATLGRYRLYPLTGDKAEKAANSYFPLIVIAAYIIGVAAINNLHGTTLDWHGWMNQLMAGFFLVFSGFKFLDLKGFAAGYATYDLLARRLAGYGLIYPFLELMLGILYLGYWFPTLTLWLTIIIMGFSSLGVINSLRKKQTIQCACLGTILKVPLSSITLFEDLLMVVLAGIQLSFF